MRAPGNAIDAPLARRGTSPDGSVREDVRGRRRLAFMRRAQATALDLFEARGFHDVTIEEIAAICDVSPPTIYRHFGTKEQLVLWDDYDPVLFESLEERLRVLPLLDALRAAILVPLDRAYAADADRIRRRARLVEKEPSLRAAKAVAMRAFRSELARCFLASGAARDALQADVLAGAFSAALESAVEHWAATNGERALRSSIQRALRDLTAFGKGRSRRSPGARHE
jgi:AcrR family transcriptional regulator